MGLKSSEIFKGFEKIGDFFKGMLEKLKIISETRLGLRGLKNEVSGGILGWFAGFLSSESKPKVAEISPPAKTDKPTEQVINTPQITPKPQPKVEIPKKETVVTKQPTPPTISTAPKLNENSKYSDIRSAYISASNNAPEGKVEPTKVMKDIAEAAEYYGVKNVRALTIILLCFARFESKFNARAINYNPTNGKGSCASGLLQFMPSTADGSRGKDGYRQRLPKDKFTDEERNRLNPAAVFNSRVNLWMGMRLLMDNARHLGINLENLKSIEAIKQATLKLYIAHNSGAGNVSAVVKAQNGDNSELERKTHGNKSHWLNKRPFTTPHVLDFFNQAVSLTNESGLTA